MARAWQCEICGAFDTDFKNQLLWWLGDQKPEPMYLPTPMEICPKCYDFLQVELNELRKRVAARKKEHGYE